MTRRKDLGLDGNGGRFAEHARSETELDLSIFATGSQYIEATYGPETVQHLEFLCRTLDELSTIGDLGKSEFMSNFVVQRAVEACVNRIGDTIKTHIPEELQDDFGGRRTWSAWVSFRVFLVHVYHRIELEQVWDSLQGDVPEFKEFLANDVLG